MSPALAGGSAAPPYAFFAQSLPAGQTVSETIALLSQQEERFTDPDWKPLLRLKKGWLSLSAGEEAEALQQWRRIPGDFPLFDYVLRLRAEAAGRRAQKICPQPENMANCRRASTLAAEASRALPNLVAPLSEEAQIWKATAALSLAEAEMKNQRPAAAQEIWLQLLREGNSLTKEQKESALTHLFAACPAAEAGDECRRRWQGQLSRLLPDIYKAPTPSPSAEKTTDEPLLAAAAKDPLWAKLHAPPAAAPDEITFRRLRNALKKAAANSPVWEEAVGFFRRYPFSPWRSGLMNAIKEQALSRPSLPPPLLKLPREELADLATLAWRNDQEDAAKALWQSFLALDPESPRRSVALYALGRMAEDAGNWVEGEKHFHQLIAEGFDAPYSNAGAFKIGQMQFRQKHYRAAIETWLRHRAAIDGDDDRGRSAFWIGLAERAAGQESAAQTAFRAAAEESPLFFYPLLASSILQRNPLEALPEKPPLTPAPRAIELSPAEERILQRAEYLLLIDGRTWAAAELSRLKGPYPATFQLYLVQLLDQAGEHRAAFSGLVKLAAQNPAVLSRETMRLLFPGTFRASILTLSEQQRLEPRLVASLIKQESAFRPDSQSRAGAVGLMQLLPGTAERLRQQYFSEELATPLRLEEPQQNLTLGIRYLRELLEQYRGNLIYTLAAYNAGPQRLDKWIKNRRDPELLFFIESIPFKETRDYVKLNLRNLAWYTALEEKAWPNLLEIEGIDFRSKPEAAPAPLPASNLNPEQTPPPQPADATTANGAASPAGSPGRR